MDGFFCLVVCGMNGFGDQKLVENKDQFGVLFSRAVLLASAAALDSPGHISLSVRLESLWANGMGH